MQGPTVLVDSIKEFLGGEAELKKHLFKTAAAVNKADGNSDEEVTAVTKILIGVDQLMSSLAVYYNAAVESQNSDIADELKLHLNELWLDASVLMTQPTIQIATDICIKDKIEACQVLIKRLNFSKEHIHHFEEQKKTKRRRTNSAKKAAEEIALSNKFDVLTVEGKEDMDTSNAQPEVEKIIKVPEAKASPFYVRLMPEWRKFLEHLNNNVVDEKIEAKLSGDSLKIVPRSIADYKKMQSYLNSNNMEYHTVHLKEERPKKVLVRGLPYGQDPLEVAADLKEKGFQVTSAMPLRDRKEGYLMPLILVCLKASPNWEQIYDITRIFSCIVTVVPFNPPRIRQCYRCQRYGHSSNGCTMPARCVKCAANHLAKECSLVKGRDKPKCALCGDPHPANYSKCSKHPDEIKRRQALEKEKQKQLRQGGKFDQRKRTETHIDAPLPTIPAWQGNNEKIKQVPKNKKTTLQPIQSDILINQDFPPLSASTRSSPDEENSVLFNQQNIASKVQHSQELHENNKKNENNDFSLADIFQVVKNFCKVINVKGLISIIKTATFKLQSTTNNEDKIYILMDAFQSFFSLHASP